MVGFLTLTCTIWTLFQSWAYKEYLGTLSLSKEARYNKLKHIGNSMHSKFLTHFGERAVKADLVLIYLKEQKYELASLEMSNLMKLDPYNTSLKASANRLNYLINKIQKPLDVNLVQIKSQAFKHIYLGESLFADGYHNKSLAEFLKVKPTSEPYIYISQVWIQILNNVNFLKNHFDHIESLKSIETESYDSNNSELKNILLELLYITSKNAVTYDYERYLEIIIFLRREKLRKLNVLKSNLKDHEVLEVQQKFQIEG